MYRRGIRPQQELHPASLCRPYCMRMRGTHKKNLSLENFRIAFVLYNLLPEDILIEKSAKKKTKNTEGW